MTATSAPSTWRKSSYSQSNGNCVEIANAAPDVAMRNSRDPQGAQLRFTKTEFKALIDGIKAGEFDDLIA